MTLLTRANALPCPWCGGTNLGMERQEDTDAPEHAWVRLDCSAVDCGAEGPNAKIMSYDEWATGEHEAVLAWNRRKDRVSARNEALEEAAKLAKEYLLLVFVDHPWANIVPTDLHASIRRLKDKP